MQSDHLAWRVTKGGEISDSGELMGDASMKEVSQSQIPQKPKKEEETSV